MRPTKHTKPSASRIKLAKLVADIFAPIIQRGGASGGRGDSLKTIREIARPLVRKLWLTVLLAGLPGTSLLAHNSPSSAVMLDFYRDRVGMELTLPLAELELSFKEPLLANPAEAFAKNETALKNYIAEHINPETADGKKWKVEVQSLALQMNQQPFDLMARVTMTPPPGATTRKFVFNYSVINHEVMSHNAYVSVRNDWDTAVFSGNPEPVGDIHFTIASLTIDRSHGNWWQGFHTVFNLGLHHIAEGTDHLLFLLALLLPAPLLAKNQRWGSSRGVKRSLMQLLKIVSAFTIGHSLTLAIGAMGLVHWPESPIEVMIAVSIFVSALHAIRPWFAGKEIFVAGGFGLIHGLAFASSLSEFNFSAWAMVSTVFSFNLGIETMQLVVVAATIPWLLLLSRTKFYAPFRIFGATFAAVAALGWIIERSFNLNLHVDSVVNIFARHPFWLVGSLATFALLATIWQWAGTYLLREELESLPVNPTN